MLKWHRAITASLAAANFGLEIAWPNKVYEPRKQIIDDDEIYMPFLELKFGGESVTPLTLMGNEGLNKVQGLFIINVRYAMNSGAVSLDDVVGNVISYYSIGRVFDYEGTQIQVMGTNMEPGAPDFGWYKTTISVKYQSYTGR